MSTSRPWRGQPYLDELRPAPGWDVDLALFATYSLDLSALGAALLALCGRNDGNGSGSIADFAQAVEALRGRARFMVQRGRIARPSRLPVLAGILDQFVVEIPYDEERRSWHPKAALVRYACDRGTMWRLWLGSRNLTRSADLDVGLLLESTTGRRKGGRRVAGIGTVGQLLAGRSGLPDLNVDAVVVELEAARWLSPEGVEVTRIDVADEGAGMRQAPAQGSFDAITVVSPFLDATFLRRVGAWGDEGTRRTLVSTRQALTAAAQARSSPLHRFDRILALDAPIPPLDVADDAASPAPLDDADPQTPSLHAKLFCFERNGKATLLVGSANATSRAWEGRNAELLAELTGGAALTEGLGHLTGSASPVAFADLKEAPPAEPGPARRSNSSVGGSSARGRRGSFATARHSPSRPTLRSRGCRTAHACWPVSPRRTCRLGRRARRASRWVTSRQADIPTCCGASCAPTPPPSAGCSGRPSRLRWTRTATSWRFPA